MGIGRRASQPARENAGDPGTSAKIWTYGLKTVRGDTGFSRFLATGECGWNSAGLSGGVPTVATAADTGPAQIVGPGTTFGL
jgi:hypothetical protein